MSADLTYFPYVIPFAFAVYGLICSLVFYIFYFHRYLTEFSDFQNCLISYLTGNPFESCYWSSLGYYGTRVLLTTRVISFLYLFGISFLAREILYPAPQLSFTSWNIDLLWIYFAIASYASIVGLYHDDCQSSWIPTNSYWSIHFDRLGYVLQILFSVGGSSAFFVTVISFSFLDRKFEFWNVSFHFVTTLAISIELLLNHVCIRWEHVVFSLSWSFLYLIFSWILIANGTFKDWPYFFLDTSTPSVFGWYAVLLILNVLFYFIFFALSLLKNKLSNIISTYIFPKFSLLKTTFELDDEVIDDIELSRL